MTTASELDLKNQNFEPTPIATIGRTSSKRPISRTNMARQNQPRLSESGSTPMILA
jgi:hypothetical protein